MGLIFTPKHPIATEALQSEEVVIVLVLSILGSPRTKIAKLLEGHK